MDTSLSVKMEALVREKVASGMYDSPFHVISAGLMMLDQEERFPIGNVEEARDKIRIGIAQVEAGHVVTDADLKAKLAKRRSRRQSEGTTMYSAPRPI